jgi:hypothetical protein
VLVSVVVVAGVEKLVGLYLRVVSGRNAAVVKFDAENGSGFEELVAVGVGGGTRTRCNVYEFST